MRDLVLSDVVVSKNIPGTPIGSDRVSTPSERGILHEGRASGAKRLPLQNVHCANLDSVAEIVDSGLEEVIEPAVVHHSRARAAGPDARATGACEKAMVH